MRSRIKPPKALTPEERAIQEILDAPVESDDDYIKLARLIDRVGAAQMEAEEISDLEH